MNNLPTPETDAEAITPSGFEADEVSAEFARKLERERDKANEDLHKQLVQFDQLFDEAEKIRIERDEAREKMADALQEVDLRTLDFERMKQERDIAEDERIDMAQQLESEKDCHARCQNKFDEVQEKVEQQRKEIVRLNGATSHAGGTPLKIALKERDEAREKLSSAWQSLRDSQDEVLRLTFENRELSQSIVGWENKWKCAVDMAARAELERDEALKCAKEYHVEFIRNASSDNKVSKPNPLKPFYKY